jgi:hypothetical protein
MEQYITAQNPELAGAILVLGAQRPRAALLIEPAAAAGSIKGGSRALLTRAEQASLVEKIWPSVEEANKTVPAHGLVDKALILVTTPHRPLVRDGTGAVQPGASGEQYATELDALYSNADFGPPGSGGDNPDAPLVSSGSGRDSIAQFVQESVSAVTSWPHEDADHQPEGTFFDQGMDSLVALQLARVLRRGLRRTDVGLSTVYCHPTVSQLTAAILALLEK